MENLFLYIMSCVSVYLRYMLFDCYLLRKKHIKNGQKIFIMFLIGFLDYLFKVKIGYSFSVNLIIILFFTTIICFLLFNGKYTTKLLLIITFVFFIVILDLLVGISLNLIFQKAILTEFKGIFKSLSSIIYYTLEFLLIYSLKKNRAKKIISGEGKLYLVQLLIPLMSIFFVTVYINTGLNQGTIETFQIYFMISIFIAINLIQYIIFEYHEKLFIENHNNILMAENYKLKDKYYESLEEHQNKIRAIKHDLKNQLITIYYYISNDTNKAKKEMQQIIDDIGGGDMLSFTQNIPINILLNHKYNIAVDKNIAFEFDIKIPGKFNILERDLIRILGNAIDNAIDANEKILEINRFIHLKMFYYNTSIVIEIINNTDGKVKNIDTRKREKEIHGFGMKSMQSLVEKYNGSMDYLIYDNKFKLGINLWDKKSD